MNKRLVVLLALAALIWGGLWLWPEAGDDSSDLGLNGPDAGPWLDAAQLSSVTHITVQAPTGEYALVKGDQGWTVIAPAMADAPGEAFLAAPDKVEALLAFVGHTPPDRRLGLMTEPGPYGLDNPPFVFTFEGDETWTLALGSENPVGTGLYAASSVDQGQCLLVTDRYMEVAERQARAYYDLRLTDLAPEQVDGVRVAWDGQEWEARRSEDGWSFTLPQDMAEDKVSQAEMELFVHELTTMEATAFRSDDPLAEHPDKEPVAVVSLWAGGEEPAATIEVYVNGDEESPYFGRATRHGHFFTLPEDAADKMQRAAFFMRERSVADLDLSSVAAQRLHQDTNGVERVLVKTETGWQDQATSQDVAGMDLLLWRLTDLKFEAEPVENLPADATRLLTWTLSSDQGGDVAVLAFYLDPNLPEDQCWIMLQGKDLYYPVSDSLLEDLQGQLLPAEADRVEDDLPPAEAGNPETGGQLDGGAAATP